MIVSAGYKFIEQHVMETCKGRWDKPILEDLRVWVSNRVVPKCTPGVLPIVRLFLFIDTLYWCTIAEEVRAVLQGIGPRFDFHINNNVMFACNVDLGIQPLLVFVWRM